MMIISKGAIAMSDMMRLTKNKLEELFNMNTGYFLDLSNAEFADYIKDETNINIYDEKYSFRSGSKANRLRAFWKLESNFIVSKLSLSFLEYWEQKFRLSSPTEEEFYRLYRLKEQAERELITLRETTSSSFDINVLDVPNLEENYRLLKEDIEKVLNDNKPQLALDRVHTYMNNYFRILCKKHNISYTKRENINNLYSKYINFHTQAGFFESTMTPSIVKIPVKALEKFNNVRNDESFAHSNNVISYRESKLIIDFVFLILAYIVDLEIQYDKSLEDNPFLS